MIGFWEILFYCSSINHKITWRLHIVFTPVVFCLKLNLYRCQTFSRLSMCVILLSWGWVCSCAHISSLHLQYSPPSPSGVARVKFSSQTGTSEHKLCSPVCSIGQHFRFHHYQSLWKKCDPTNGHEPYDIIYNIHTRINVLLEVSWMLL